MVQENKKDGFWNRNKYTLCLVILLSIGGVLSYEKVRVMNLYTDELTNSTVTIDYEHHTIHDGHHCFLCDFESLGLNDELNFSFFTNNTRTHMTFEISSLLGVELNIYENVTVTGGTNVTAFNNNRNSEMEKMIELKQDPTVTSGGIRIFGSRQGSNREAGFVKRSNELILKNDTTYMFNIISLGANNVVSYCGEWYNGHDYMAI